MERMEEELLEEWKAATKANLDKVLDAYKETNAAQTAREQDRLHALGELQRNFMSLVDHFIEAQRETTETFRKESEERFERFAEEQREAMRRMEMQAEEQRKVNEDLKKQLDDNHKEVMDAFLNLQRGLGLGLGLGHEGIRSEYDGSLDPL
jgi:DNA anti-recombination protein RmuC